MRAYNFNAGPAALPEAVLRTAAAEMLDWHGCGMSVMEMSHRSPEFTQIIEGAEAGIRQLLGIPENYRVLFMQGGGTGQFAAVAMNLMHHGVADYLVSGRWSMLAQREAAKYGDARVIASSEADGFSYTPDCSNLAVDPEADYVYICANETVNGTRYTSVPDTHGTPLVADVSSCFLSEPMDVAAYGLIYGGVQKNVGPAGVTIVIIRDDLVADAPAFAQTPLVLDYATTAKKKSLYNTPACWNIYICGLVFDWLREQGGLEEVGRRNRAKAAALYDYLDASQLFRGYARKDSRSIMNVTFTTGDADTDAAFIAATKEAGLVGIKGHRSQGGMRASIYNAVSLEAVQTLVGCMDRFESAWRSSSSSSSSSASSI